MGQSLAIPRVIPNDWKRLDLIVNKIKMRLGRDSSPTFAGLTLTGLTPTSVPFIDTGGVVSEDSELTWDKDNNYLNIGYIRLGGERIIRANGPGVNQGITINAQGNDGVYFNLTDGGTAGVYFYNGTTQKLAQIRGTTYGEGRFFDEDYAEWLQFACSSGYGFLEVKGTTPKPLILNNSAESDVWLFQASGSGETQGFRVYGYKAGDAKRYLDVTVGGTADDTVDFTGLGNYKFGGTLLPDALTTTGTIDASAGKVLVRDDADSKPTEESDGYISVYEDGATKRFYTFVGGKRYYVNLTDDWEIEVGNPIGLLLALTYAA